MINNLHPSLSNKCIVTVTVNTIDAMMLYAPVRGDIEAIETR